MTITEKKEKTITVVKVQKETYKPNGEVLQEQKTYKTKWLLRWAHHKENLQQSKI